MANPEHLALAREGSAAVNRFASQNPGVPLDLSGADLSSTQLQGCSLQAANLSGADFAGANLRNADLSGADLRNASLAGVDLRSANLRGADARGAVIHRARLDDADLRGLAMEAIGVGRQLVCTSPSTFQNARWDRARLEEMLSMLNLNRDWEIRYEIVPRA